jgi:tetratricopeptide (TPR) repeat protein
MVNLARCHGGFRTDRPAPSFRVDLAPFRIDLAPFRIDLAPFRIVALTDSVGSRRAVALADSVGSRRAARLRSVAARFRAPSRLGPASLRGDSAPGPRAGPSEGRRFPREVSSQAEQTRRHRPAAMKRLRTFLALGLVAALSAPSVGFAQSADRAAPRVRDALSGEALEAFDRAREHFANGRYADARAEFERAHALSGDARVLYNVAVCDKELGRYARAAARLRQSLATTTPLSGEYVERARGTSTACEAS